MATTRPTSRTSTRDTTTSMDLDADARYRTGDDYWSQPDDGPGPQVMAADTLTGNEVRNNADDTLGEISDIMLDVPTGRVAYRDPAPRNGTLLGSYRVGADGRVEPARFTAFRLAAGGPRYLR